MFKDILLCVDLAHESSWTKALPAAVDLCNHWGATLHVLNVVPDFGLSLVSQYFPEGYEQEVKQKALGDLRDFVKANLPAGIKVQHIVGEGTVYDVILKTIEEISADLVVMSAHRADLKDYLLGPNAARVVRHANCSVMVVRE
ncbi:MAG: universal stress protein [Alphaproteobacteria bacterium]|jgi:nucleotide-binding universal stress UspA family protein|nr:universal stress protein [Alphaproteobacteria bacterium]